MAWIIYIYQANKSPRGKSDQLLCLQSAGRWSHNAGGIGDCCWRSGNWILCVRGCRRSECSPCTLAKLEKSVSCNQRPERSTVLCGFSSEISAQRAFEKVTILIVTFICIFKYANIIDSESLLIGWSLIIIILTFHGCEAPFTIMESGLLKYDAHVYGITFTCRDHPVTQNNYGRVIEVSRTS